MQHTNNVAGQREPVWNQVLTFDVKTGYETIKVQVLDFASSAKGDVIGVMELPLRELCDECFDADEAVALIEQDDHQMAQVDAEDCLSRRIDQQKLDKVY